MITIDQIKSGYNAGIIKLIESPHEDGVVCSIGEYWFYFGGHTAEESTVEEYKKYVPVEDIAKEIFYVLEDFRKEGYELLDEYNYYESYLLENKIY